jgi:ubiquinone/menaquinone biosynthesis C-methylase UbiE
VLPSPFAGRAAASDRAHLRARVWHGMRVEHRVDYDERQHVVYSRGRDLTPEVARLWLEVLARYIDAAQRAILDVGSGTGMYSRLLADSLGATVVGVEPSARMREIAKRDNAHSRVRYVEGCAEQIPIESASCDVALLSNVIHHIGDPRAAVSELARVLRPGGLVFVRGTLRESLGRVPWLEFFPAAQPVAERQLPSRPEVGRMFAGEDFDLVASEAVDQECGANMRAYYERIKMRPISTLELISDAEFERGIARMRKTAERETDPQPVIEQVDLVVFRHT